MLFYVTSLPPAAGGNREKKARERMSEGALNGEGREKENEQHAKRR